MNGGGLASNAEPATTPVYSATNGNWNSGTGIYTPSTGTTPASTVVSGDWAHVFVDGATTPAFIGRVTNVAAGVNGAITISTSAKSGTAPTTAGTGISINVGGAWLGPSGASGFPFNFATASLQNSSSDRPRINFKNDATYSITAGISATNPSGMIRYQGYSTTFGDLGRAVIDGGTTGTSYILLTVANANVVTYADFVFQNNGATGSADGLRTTNTNAAPTFLRVVCHDVRGTGFATSGNFGLLHVECEAYNCNQSNSTGKGGFTSDAALSTCIRCIAHDNTGNGSDGFGSIRTLINCIADSNGRFGFFLGSDLEFMVGCDAYNNGSSGIVCNIGGNQSLHIESCNLVKNGAYGIDLQQGAGVNAIVINCGFGSGTQANTSGTVRLPSSGGVAEVVGSVTYAANTLPWVDAANGDFRINLAAAKNAGRGNFMQTAASYAGTIAYPDIGAAQHQDTGGASGPVAQLKTFGRGSPY